NSSGTVIWARSATGDSSDLGYGIATDASSNVFVTGFYSSPTLQFDSITLTNSANLDVFLAKLDSGGNVLWAKSGSGNYVDEGMSVAADPWGNVYLTGNFMSFSITFDNVTLFQGGTCDFFLVKYDASGNVLWAKSKGG